MDGCGGGGMDPEFARQNSGGEQQYGGASAYLSPEKQQRSMDQQMMFGTISS